VNITQSERGGQRKIARNNGLGKSIRSADTPFENLLHVPHFSQKRSLAGLLVLENIPSPFYSLLTNREMLHSLLVSKMIKSYLFFKRVSRTFILLPHHMDHRKFWHKKCWRKSNDSLA